MELHGAAEKPELLADDGRCRRAFAAWKTEFRNDVRAADRRTECRMNTKYRGKENMPVDQVKEYLAKFGLDGRVQEFEESSATVAEAAADLGCEPARIAKTMAFETGEGPALIVIAGDGKVDNPRYKARFHCKAVMVRPDELMEKVGHPMGGVCPFAIRDDVPVYLDESLRRFDVVYPAAGTAASAVRLTVPELERAAQNFAGWVDIAKGWRAE